MIRNVLLAEFTNEKKYAYEIIKPENFNPDYLDKRFRELIGEGDIVWAVTDSEVEIAYEISYTAQGIQWQTYRKLYYNDSYKLLYDKNGTCDTLEDALSEALIAFAALIDRHDEPETMLEDSDYDDDISINENK